MEKKSVSRFAFFLAAAALSTFVWAAFDVEVTSVDVSGTQINVTLHNPTSTEETARVQVTVSEVGGGVETLQSATSTIAAGATQTVTLTASQAVVGITDDPQPLPGN